MPKTLTTHIEKKRYNPFQALKRTLRWAPRFGENYDKYMKKVDFGKLFDKLDKEGKLGPVIVTAGSGTVLGNASKADNYVPKITHSGRPHTFINIDIGQWRKFTRKNNTLGVRLDIEQAKDLPLKVRTKIAKFLGSGTKRKPINTVILSDVLNYVDYEKAIRGLSRYIVSGGRIVIFNIPNRGHERYFSRQGAHNTAKLVEFLKKQGYTIEHSAPLSGHYPSIKETVYEGDGLIIVGKKN